MILTAKAKEKGRAEPGIKWWKLDEEDCKRKFRKKGRARLWVKRRTYGQISQKW